MQKYAYIKIIAAKTRGKCIGGRRSVLQKKNRIEKYNMHAWVKDKQCTQVENAQLDNAAPVPWRPL